MNCRLNEEKVFPSPEVSQVLERHFVEARLHVDGERNIERILELQQELARSVATPLYLIQDPRSKARLGDTVGGVTTVAAFREFLLDAVAAQERVGRLPGR